MYFKQVILLFVIGSSILSCRTDKAEQIVEKAISFSGGNLFNNHIVEFDFRNKHITIDENNGEFTYIRTYIDTLGNHIQTFNNQGLRYTIDATNSPLDEKKEASIIESINSQVYFTMLPYKLRDPAVVKQYIGKESIKGKEYHKIKITFRQDGGGVDYEDQFLYWFDSEDYSMDYLAYLFHVNDGGMRFREAKNVRKIQGVIFQDYDNYKPAKAIVLDSLSILFQNDGLIKLSEINLQNIEVKSR